MKTLNELPEVTEQVLGGLTADDVFKQKILSAAAGSDMRKDNISPIRRVIPVLLATAAVMVLLIAGITSFSRNSQVTEPRIQTISAGSYKETIVEYASRDDDSEKDEAYELTAFGAALVAKAVNPLTD